MLKDITLSTLRALRENKPMNKSKYIFLSYALSPKLSAYADGKRIVIDEVRKISSCDSSNNTEIHLTTHFGTHIDFPNHFNNEGKTVDDYPAEYFIFNHVKFVDIQNQIIDNEIINTNHFYHIKSDHDTELLLIKTGYSYVRNKEKYWKENPAFHPELARFFRNHFSNLRVIGFDTISLSSWNRRNIGKEAHKAFLIENEILLVEDMDLSEIDSTSKIEKVIVSPLRISGLEGAPVTVFACVKK